MIADRLKLLMGDQSARKFATKLGVSPSTMHEYLKGRMIPLDLSARICGHFGCSLEWLATGNSNNDEDEQDLLNQFRKLDDRQKGNIIEIMAGYEALEGLKTRETL